MINAILMIGSMIAAGATIALGLIFTFRPFGSVWMGLTLTVMGVVISSACVPASLVGFRRRRHRRHLREQAARSELRPNTQRPRVTAHTQEPKLRLVKAVEEKPAPAGKNQPPAAA